MTRKLYSLCGADPRHLYSPHCWKVVMALAHQGPAFEEIPTAYAGIREIGNGFSSTVPVLDDNVTCCGTASTLPFIAMTLIRIDLRCFAGTVAKPCRV